MTTPDDVLRFWFGEPPQNESEMMEQIRRWFRGGKALDREIADGFGPAVEAALSGELDGWADEPRSRLALVILLDQFTRNVFRGDPRTHAGDPKAQALALDAFDRGLDDSLSFVERLFLSMPLMHAESLPLQQRLGEIVAVLRSTAPPEYRVMAAMHAEQSAKYTDVIARFGRFPHRNQLLGRESTAAELAFLTDWEQKGPPRGAPPVTE